MARPTDIAAIPLGLTFDDVLLQPLESSVLPSQADTRSRVTREIASKLGELAQLLDRLGQGRFENVSHQTWVADPRGAMGLAVGDWDRDGK